MGAGSKPFLPNVPVILIGNKKDLRNDENTKKELRMIFSLWKYRWLRLHGGFC